MHVDFDCHQATINTIEQGVFFAASIAGETTFCLSVQSDGERELSSFLTLWPGHPALKNKVGVLHGSVISNQPILVYNSAQIVPSPNSQHLDFEVFRGAPIGSLILIGEELFIQAATGRGSAIFSCRDGSAKRSSLIHSNRIVFTSWEVMIAGPGGEPHTLCVIDTAETQTPSADVFS